MTHTSRETKTPRSATFGCKISAGSPSLGPAEFQDRSHGSHKKDVWPRKSAVPLSPPLSKQRMAAQKWPSVQGESGSRVAVAETSPIPKQVPPPRLYPDRRAAANDGSIAAARSSAAERKAECCYTRRACGIDPGESRFEQAGFSEAHAFHAEEPFSGERWFSLRGGAGENDLADDDDVKSERVRRTDK